MLNGYKTYIVAFLLGCIPVATTILGGLDWNALIRSAGVPEQLVVPVAAVVAAMVMAGMRKITELTTVKHASK